MQMASRAVVGAAVVVVGHALHVTGHMERTVDPTNVLSAQPKTAVAQFDTLGML
jgi:hypothetical protein